MMFLKGYMFVDLFVYCYDDLGLSFVCFDLMLCELFDIVILMCYFVIMFDEVCLLFYFGCFDFGKIDDKIEFYFVVFVDMLSVEFVDVVLVCFKVGVLDDVDKFVLLVMFGVWLLYML